MIIAITAGWNPEIDPKTGEAVPPTDDIMAKNAYMASGKIFVPMVHWEKDFKGQVTNGRIGAPKVRWCPIDWLGSAQSGRVKQLIADMAQMKEPAP